MLAITLTAVYGRAQPLLTPERLTCVYMTTQHDRIKELMKETGRDWRDIFPHVAVRTRAGKKKWRDGDFTQIKSANLLALAKLFGCEPRWLESGTGPKFKKESAASGSSGWTPRPVLNVLPPGREPWPPPDLAQRIAALSERAIGVLTVEVQRALGEIETGQRLQKTIKTSPK
ncbi:MAG: hypothetical protein KGL39_15515 [Patescibacteria group bacterium]|nr:hypothetical protein [Patescibacteria group bacterium]